MVDLPQAPQGVVTSTAPQTALSASKIAEPYEQLGAALDKLGGGLNAVAVPLAEYAGARAVTRDADGNIQVEPTLPIFGPAGFAYARAVKVGALAQGDGQAKRDDIDLREQHRDDPQGYEAAANAYKQKMVQQYTQAAGPEVGNAIGQTIDQTTTQTYRGLLNEKARLDLQKADNNISAGIKSASDDALALARQGVAAEDPSMQSLLGKYATLLGERTNNPRLAYTPDQAKLDFDTFQSDLAANRYLHHIDQTYQAGGFQAAETDAKDILTNTDYKLSDAQRESYYHKAIGEVRANEAIRRQDIGEARASFNELTMASATGARIDPDQVEQTANAFRAANDPGGAARVYASFARKPLNDDFGRQPIGDQTSQLNALRAAQAAQQAMSFFTGKGYTPEQASGIVGNLMHESGVDPTLSGDAGTSGGIAQFHNERLTALRQFAADQGKPATDFQTQLEFIDRELHGKEGATLAKLQGAKTPEQAAAAFVNYERPAGYTPENPAGSLGFQNRQALARTVFDGKPADGSGGPAATAWLTANRQRGLDKELWTGWQTAMKDYSEKGIRPNDEAVTQIIDGARATGNAALLEQVGHDMGRIDLAQTDAQRPLAQQRFDITRLTAAGQAGNLSVGQAATLKDLQTRYDAISKGLEDNPIQTAVANFPDKFKAVGPLDFTDPQKLTAGLQQRAQIAQMAAHNWQSGPLAALDKGDVVQAKAALANPDPAVKAGIYGAIAQLPEDVRGATLKKLGGNEPAGMAEAAAGSMMATAPDVAASIFRGQAAMKAEPRYNPEGGEGAPKATYLRDMDRLLPATAFSLTARTNPSGDYVTMSTMIKARYADLSAQAGQTDYNFNRLSQATDDVTGGVLKHNGSSFIAPARGMTQPQFDGVLQGVSDNDLAGVKTINGQPVTAQYLRGSAQLESVNEGQYLVRLGRSTDSPIYAFKGAKPFVLDLRGRTAASVQIPAADTMQQAPM